MKKMDLCLAVVAMIVQLNATGQNVPVIEWQKTFGGSNNDGSHSVRPVAGGFVVAGGAGSIDGDVVGSNGSSDFWVMKLDSLGNMEWQNALGGMWGDAARAMEKTADGGYILAGVTNSWNGDVTGYHAGQDFWVAKLDSLGDLQWQDALGGSDWDFAFDVQQAADGSYVAVGYTNSDNGEVTGNHGGYDCWVVKLSASGNLLWQKALGGTGYERAESVQPTVDGGCVVAGYTTSNNGDVSGNHGGNDAWVVKLDSLGNMLWQKTFGGASHDHAHFIRSSPGGGFVVAGRSNSDDGDVVGHQGQGDFWVLKIDDMGNLQWQKTLGGTGYDSANSIQPTPDGGYVVVGRTDSNDGDVSGNHGQGDIWVVKIDGIGNLLWQKVLGGSASEEAYSSATSAGGGYVVAGYTGSNDGDVGENNGDDDFWVVKLLDEDYAQLQGKVFSDLNSDNMQSAGEQSLVKHLITNLNTGRPYISTGSGQYNVFILDTGLTTVAPGPLAYYSPAPANHSSNFPTLNQQVDPLNDFAMQPSGSFNDLCVTMSPVGFYRPGFVCQYSIDYTNIGTTTLTPDIVLVPDPWLTFDSASIAPTTVNADSVVWQLTPISPFQTGQITAWFTVDPSTGIGTTLSTSVRIEQLIGDANAHNNTETWNVVTTGSYDPNDILVDRTSVLLSELNPVPPDLDYIIRFQNTGNDTAFTVRIENNVPQNADLNSFQFVAASHSVEANYLQHVDRFEFRFDNILLPDSGTNEASSHGFIRYRIKPRSTLMLGDSVLNQAGIFFDFNMPIITNTAHTVIDNSTNVTAIATNGFSVSPNPTDGSFLLTLSTARSVTVSITDVAGREVLQERMIGSQNAIDISAQPPGVYLVTVGSEAGNWTEKIILD